MIVNYKNCPLVRKGVYYKYDPRTKKAEITAKKSDYCIGNFPTRTFCPIEKPVSLVRGCNW